MVVLPLATGLLATSASAQAAPDEELVKAARRAARVVEARARTKGASVMGPDFTGAWAGRYVYVRSASTCPSPISGFLFRHLLRQNYFTAILLTSHDGAFAGVSQDRGRRVAFGKTVSTRGGPANIAVIYTNLGKDGATVTTGYGLNVAGCTVVFGAVGIRQ